MIHLAIHHTTTSAADDHDATGPEYAGRVLCITWLGWTLEIALTRRTHD